MNHKKLSGLRNIVAYSLYPLILSLGIITTWYLYNSGFSILISMLIPVASANAIIWAFEFIQPFNLDWRPPAQSLKLDIIYAVSTSLIVTPLLKMGILSFIIKYNITGSGMQIWPVEWPLYLQVPLAILIADLFIYVAHRWLHKSDLGWKIHVIHHSTEKMHFWAGSRSHVLNVTLVYAGEIATLLFLGIPAETLALFTVFIAINGVFEHSNIDLRHGFLNRIFSTADVHRVHHSTNWKLSNQNFGTSTCIWDQIFGTYTLPKEPIRIQGIVMHKLPERYWEQFKAPFMLDKYKVKPNKKKNLLQIHTVLRKEREF